MKKIRVTVTSACFDPAQEEKIYAENPDVPNSELNRKLDEISEITHTSSDGELRRADGQVTVTYGGSTDEAKMTLTFSESNPESITVCRSGDCSFVFHFDPKNPIVNCDYRVGGLTIPMTLHTSEVKNTLRGEKGQVILSYTLLNSGRPVQRVRLSTKILPRN